MSAEINYHQVLEDLYARREALDDAIASMEKVVAFITGEVPKGGGPSGPATMSGGGSKARAGSPAQLRSDTFFGMSATEAVKAYLRIVKEPKTVREITDALLAGGWKTTTSGNKLTASMFTTMKRLKDAGDVVSPNKGEWGLMDWYPALRNKRTQKEREGASTEVEGRAENEEGAEEVA